MSTQSSLQNKQKSLNDEPQLIEAKPNRWGKLLLGIQLGPSHCTSLIQSHLEGLLAFLLDPAFYPPGFLLG
ncbi:hypothetical protein E2320_004421, partial [Naja naja]